MNPRPSSRFVSPTALTGSMAAGLPPRSTRVLLLVGSAALGVALALLPRGVRAQAPAAEAAPQAEPEIQATIIQTPDRPMYDGPVIEEMPRLYRADNGDYELPLGKGGVIRSGQYTSRVAVGNPRIADIVVLRPNEVYVVGKQVGTTNVSLWNKNDQLFATVNVNVTPDVMELKRTLFDLFPNDRIGVQSARQSLVLTGEVSSLPRVQAAQDLAQGYLPCAGQQGQGQQGQNQGQQQAGGGGGQQQGGGMAGGGQRNAGCQIINLMQVGGAQQVMLEVKVAEVARTVLNRLDGQLNFLRFTPSGAFGSTSAGGVGLPVTGNPAFGGAGDALAGASVLGGPGFFANLLLGNNNVLQAVLEISRRNDLAKILAEPTLTTLSGQEAEFLSGGEFPIPVPQGIGNQITIEFKDFGVGVKFVPVVLDSGHINLKLAVNVSDITDANNVTLSLGGSNAALLVPSLEKRSASSTVELANGQTMAIAGLLSDNVREFVSKFPILGDLPVLGALFRSQEYRHDESELVIFVTPHLAKPMAPELVRQPTDKFVPPNAVEFYLLGRLESGSAPRAQYDSFGRVRGNGDGSVAATGATFGHAQ